MTFLFMHINKFMSDEISLEIKQQYNIYIFIWYNLNGYCVYLSLSTHTCTVGLSVACASTCNLLLMRNSELSTGIEVEDHNGNVIGKSKVAAKKVKKTFTSTNKRMLIYLMHLYLYKSSMTIMVQVFVYQDK